MRARSQRGKRPRQGQERVGRRERTILFISFWTSSSFIARGLDMLTRGRGKGKTGGCNDEGELVQREGKRGDLQRLPPNHHLPLSHHSRHAREKTRTDSGPNRTSIPLLLVPSVAIPLPSLDPPFPFYQLPSLETEHLILLTRTSNSSELWPSETVLPPNA
jgi:hypothetical protein